MNNTFITVLCGCLLILSACNTSKIKEENDSSFAIKSKNTLDSLDKYYSSSAGLLLFETHPNDLDYQATYLDAPNKAIKEIKYAYLWPYSGVLSGAIALYESTQDPSVYTYITDKLIPGLEEYYDTTRNPSAYASYIKVEGGFSSDRFYDDNIWLGIDFTTLYLITKQEKYIDRAKAIWQFIESGTDDNLGGGVYWVEQNKSSKNACSNAPGAVFALKLFEATKDSIYYHDAITLYQWTKYHLQDPEDGLIFDNINLSGEVDKAKYAYNTGQMIQAASLLYQITGDESYLGEAKRIANAGYNYFFETDQLQQRTRVLKNTDIWFIAVMMRGYLELYNLDNNPKYLYAFIENLDFSWEYMRDENGLFNTDWKGEIKDKKKWLLTQAGMVEMFAKLHPFTQTTKEQ